MKKNIFLNYLCILLIGGFLSSCNDELNDELFHKFVYLSTNGWQSYEIDVDENNMADLHIYLGINGTSENDKSIVVKLATDPDTLAAYNFDKYKYQTQYYYPQLPASCYAFDKESYPIAAGEIKATSVITIDLKKIENPYTEYVLPLKIESSTGMEKGMTKYTKVLANIFFMNPYSGQFSGNGTLKEEGSTNTKDWLNVSGIKLYATSVNSCYMYAGNITRTNTGNYTDYAIDITFNEDETIDMSSPNPELELIPVTAKIERTYTNIADDNRYYNQASLLSLRYKYRDLSPEEERFLDFSGDFNINKKVLKTDYPDIVVED